MMKMKSSSLAGQKMNESTQTLHSPLLARTEPFDIFLDVLSMSMLPLFEINL